MFSDLLRRKKDQMKTKFRGGGLEKKLFHGTRPEIVDNICKENFDWRLYGRNTTVYGQGSYFAQNASYSDSYATDENNFTSRFMFLADVLVGSYVEGDSSMRRPPPKNPYDPTSDLYDSCVEISERQVFECICNEYDCTVQFAVISTRQDLFPNGKADAEAWFKKAARRNSFIITEGENGELLEITAFSSKLRLCFQGSNCIKQGPAL